MGAYNVLNMGGEQYWVGYETPATHRMKMCFARARGISGVRVHCSLLGCCCKRVSQRARSAALPVLD